MFFNRTMVHRMGHNCPKNLGHHLAHHQISHQSKRQYTSVHILQGMSNVIV